MQLDFAMLALAADHSAHGKLHVFGGGFDTMGIPTLPANVPPFNIVARILGDDPKDAGTTHTLTVAIINPKGETTELGESNNISFTTNKTDPSRASNVIVIFVIGITFESYGIYTFELKLDGQKIKSIPLDIRTEIPPQ